VVRSPESDDEPARPPWHWVGFGTVAIFVAWLPLAFLAQWLTSGATQGYANGSAEATAERLAHLPRGEWLKLLAMMILPHVAALGLGSLAGGYLVGRYGPQLGAREGAIAGFAAGLIAVVLAARGAGLSPALLCVLPIAAAFAGWGGRIGARTRALS
jgi:tRNA-(ms[2]io[6]A)-hydroxylase